MRRMLSLLTLCALLAGQAAHAGDLAPAPSLCPHHPAHDSSCGYVQAVPGSPCTHEHTEACTVSVTHCTHVHDETCGGTEPEAPAEQPPAPTPEPGDTAAGLDTPAPTPEPEGAAAGLDTPAPAAEEGDAAVTLDAPAPPIAAAAMCSHVCSVESGCITLETHCPHTQGTHDDSCGYVEAVPGAPCGYVCTECAAGDAPDTPDAPPLAPPVTCTCTTLCAEGAADANCPVCSAEDADLSLCTGTEAPAASTCTCAALCTDGAVDPDCPVCSAEDADLSLCTGMPLLPLRGPGDPGYQARDMVPNRAEYGGFLELQLSPIGQNNWFPAYCFNASWASPTPGPIATYYQEENVSAETFAEYAHNERNSATLRQDVFNVVWNGYPYYGTGWEGIKKDYTGWISRLGGKQLWYDIRVTQNAVWYYTDSLDLAALYGTDSWIYKEVMALIQRAEQPENHAPANFELDLYDSTYAGHTPEGKRYQNLLAVRGQPPYTVDVTIEKFWENEDGSAYTGDKPDITFELYRGSSIPSGATPIQTIPLPAGQTKVTFKLFNDGGTYTLREVLSGQTKTFTVKQNDQVITLGDSSAGAVKFTNVYRSTGGFQLKKTVQDAAAAGVSFSFAVTLNRSDGTPYAGAYTIAYDSGEPQDAVYDPAAGLTVQLENGRSCAIAGLPAGVSYTVEETPMPEGYEFFALRKDTRPISGTVAQGTVVIDTAPLYEFVNKKEDTTPLIVQKTVDGTPHDAGDRFVLTVHLYTDAAHTTPYTGKYSLNGDPLLLPYEADTGIGLTLGDREYAMIGGLPADQTIYYTITENPVQYYEPVQSTVSGEVTAPGVWVEYHNRPVEPPVYALTLRKQVVGGTPAQPFTFSVALDGDKHSWTPAEAVTASAYDSEKQQTVYTVQLAGGEAVTFSGMPAGYQFFVQETDDPVSGYLVTDTTIDASPGLSAGGKTVTVIGGVTEQNIEMTYTNTVQKLVDLRLTKQITGGLDPSTGPYHFELELWHKGQMLADGQTHPAKRVAADSTVTPSTLTFDENGVAQVLLEAGETLLLEELPAGEYFYRWTEVDAERFRTTITAPAAVTQDENTRTVSGYQLDKDTDILFVNRPREAPEPETGGLSISKTVTGAGDTSRSWHFTVQLSDPAVQGAYGDLTFTDGVAQVTLKHGETAAATGLPKNLTYTVTETEANQDGYTTSAVADSGTIPAGGTATAAFTNHKPTSPPGGGSSPDPAVVQLRAQKTLDGKAPDGQTFTFLLKDADGKVLQTRQNSGGNVTFQPLTFRSTGTFRYTITEQAGTAPAIRYDPAVYEVTVTVTRSGDYHAAVSLQKDGAAYTGTPLFANTTEQPAPETTSLTVRKVWSGGAARPVEVQLYRNGVPYGDRVTLSTQNGWQHSWTGLAASDQWSVDETAIPAGFVRTISRDGTVWTITNTYTPTQPNTPRTPRTLDPGVPRTGDTQDNTGWMALALLSLAGMAAIAWWDTRKKSR